MSAVVRSLTIALLVISTMATPAGVARAQQGCEFWVAPPPTGDDTQPGTAAAPWATLEHAAETVPDAGCTVWIADGLYVGQTQLERRFTLPTTFKASSPYHATFEHSGTVLDIDGARNIIIEGLELRHTGPGATGYVVIMDRSGEIWSEDIVLRNNVLHDSYDNDLLKIHHGVRFATVEGNLFYNQGPGEQHIDVNSVTDVTVQDNVFFNDYVASGREISEDAKHFIIVKDSNASEDGLEGSQRITIRRNVFFNWQGGPEIFVKVGNDGKPIHEAVDVWIQSNLLIGNSPDVVGAAFGVAGAKNVFFTNNTVVGNLPSKAYAFRVETKGDNPPNENITFANNIWSDPTGTMGADGPGDGNAFSTGDDGSTVNLVLDTNLYWNGGAVIPAGDVASPLSDDANAVIGDPMLASDQSALVTPVWTGNGFADDSTTVREVFVELVEAYGAIPAGSPAIGGADPDAAPIDDVLGNPRSDPDLGAYEQGATSSGTFVDDGNVHEGFIVVLGGPAAISDDVLNYLDLCTTADVSRVAGANRYATAAAFAVWAGFPTGGTAFITTGENFPDALPAGPRASDETGPILLTRPTSLPGVTASALASLSPSKTVILGGTSAVSAQVEDQLRNGPYGTVERIAGSNRYTTAAAVAASSTLTGTTVYVATGENFPDALAGSHAAATADAPILLVTRDTVPSATRKALVARDPESIVILGGTAVVSSGVATELKAYAPTVRRLSGSNRFGTAAAISKDTYPSGAAKIYIATGENYPDALAAGAVVGPFVDGPILLATKYRLPAETAAEISRLSGIPCAPFDSQNGDFGFQLTGSGDDVVAAATRG